MDKETVVLALTTIKQELSEAMLRIAIENPYVNLDEIRRAHNHVLYLKDSIQSDKPL